MELSSNPEMIRTVRSSLKLSLMRSKLNCGSWIMIIYGFFDGIVYYGMNSLFTSFYIEYIGKAEDLSKPNFHNVIHYVTPLLSPVGAIIADNYLGRFWPIIIFGFISILGMIIATFTSISTNKPGFFVGMHIFAIGNGLVYATVQAFGGDQTPDPSSVELTSAFFSLKYLFFNTGAFFAFFVSPYIKEFYGCISDHCYPLAYGTFSAVFLIQFVLFAVSKSHFRIIQIDRNVMTRMFCLIKCVIQRKWRLRKDMNLRSSCLDYFSSSYSISFIQDIKKVIAVIILFIPFPIFWALIVQMESRWIRQAKLMENIITNDVYEFTQRMQLISPLIVFLFIPMFDYLINPILDTYDILTQPVSRIFIGFYIAGFSFMYAGFLQMAIDNAAMVPELSQNESLVRFLNIGSCNVTISSAEMSPLKLGSAQFGPLVVFKAPSNVSVQLISKCATKMINQTVTLSLAERSNFTISLAVVESSIGKSFFSVTPPTQCRSMVPSEKVVKFVMSPELVKSGGDVGLIKSKSIDVKLNSGPWTGVFDSLNMTEISIAQSDYFTIKGGTLDAVIKRGTTFKQLKALKSRVGIAETFALWNVTDPKFIEIFEVHLDLINIVWQIPQYFLFTIAEVFFVVTSTTVAYSEAPKSMKSISQSLHQFTIMFGNIILVMTSAKLLIENKVGEFLFFAGSTFGTGTLSMYLCWSYMKKKKSMLMESTTIDAEPDSISESSRHDDFLGSTTS